MQYGPLPLAITWNSEKFEPMFVGYNAINIQAMTRPSRLLIYRRMPNRMITFGTQGGLPDDQINILYNNLVGLGMNNPPEYEQCLRAMVWSSWSVFWDMRDLYYFLLHLEDATRTRLRGIIIHDITRGPYTKDALKLLKGCTKLKWIKVHLCPICGDTRAPTGRFNHWNTLVRGIGRLSTGPARNVTVRPRKPNQWCEKCLSMWRPGQPPPHANPQRMDERRAIVRRYLRRP